MEKNLTKPQPDETDHYAFADVAVDVLAHRQTRDGHEVAVEPKPFAVLLDLLAHPDQLRRRNELLDAV